MFQIIFADKLHDLCVILHRVSIRQEKECHNDVLTIKPAFQSRQFMHVIVQQDSFLALVAYIERNVEAQKYSADSRSWQFGVSQR